MIKRIQHKIKRELLNLKFRTGLHQFSANQNHKILVYHGIAPHPDNSLNIRHIATDVFEKHLQFLKKNTHVIPVEDFFEQKFIAGKKNVAITFDDGYLNNLKYAVPLLEAYKVPAAIYITGINTTAYPILWPDYHDLAVVASTQNSITYKDIIFYRNGSNPQRPYLSKDNINLHEFLKTLPLDEKMQLIHLCCPIEKILSNSSNYDAWKLMTNHDIVELSKSKYITIGSHGMYHNNLGFIDSKEAEQELMNSKKYLENLTNKAVTGIAYPDGSYSREVIRLAQKNGFKEQLAVNYLFEEDKSDNRIIDREGMYSFETLAMQYQNIHK